MAAATDTHTKALLDATAAITAAVAARDEAIRQAYADGLSAIEISAAVGLTRGRVHQLVKAAS